MYLEFYENHLLLKYIYALLIKQTNYSDWAQIDDVYLLINDFIHTDDVQFLPVFWKKI